MSVLILLLLLIISPCVAGGCPGSFFTKAGHLDNTQIEGSVNIAGSVRLTQYARHCHSSPSCSSFVHNEQDMTCQLMSVFLVDPGESPFVSGSAIYRKIDDEAVCQIPKTITNGRLLFFDGQRVGSKAEFVCDDYYFPTTEGGVCSSIGVWTGLNDPCVSATRGVRHRLSKYFRTGQDVDGFSLTAHVMNEPYYIPAAGKIYPGMCMIIMATPTGNRIRFRLQNSTFYYNFIISVRFVDKRIVRNSKINGKFETEEDDTPYWPFVVNQEFNLTVCAEENMYRVFVDSTEMFTFAYRHPLSDIVHAVLDNDVVMRRYWFVG